MPREHRGPAEHTPHQRFAESTMKCNHCGYDTAMNAAFCPRCGATPPHGGKQAYDGLVKILGTILGIAVLGPSSASGKPQEQARCRQLSGSSLPRAADWLRGRGLARRTGACGARRRQLRRFGLTSNTQCGFSLEQSARQFSLIR